MSFGRTASLAMRQWRSREHQRIADVFGRGGDIEQQPRLARVRLLGEVQSKFVVLQRLHGVFEKLALRHRRDATLTDVALRNAGPLQHRPHWDVARAKEGDGLPRGESRCAW